ncbi:MULTISPECIES: tyrosine-type recombinase/integrase [unclassified Campylobacter]|uniref:tyrosine-type recombinase/integrase n=1 Tax=unclassified Campylobacter TaxID=2593542 RepID=UPI0022E9C391|nr:MULTISPECIES: site-specific integrase [unclassified Campylobacter]MDA3043978.1 site-specific integrase [Campylobacter sp. JMF_09 ED2]MDA3045533.1 site-specific integrase [Campylobacter sp. JMF_07 ED4]MDA3064660.1 site-specific integrase [Campylobacter sp. JMF_11 EL3]MDA3072046.1 site-specific integrase [Campylobacter sp. VBCF_03 NA9]MDA3075751.1 site-specific integrase [Campylobacter sp. JMF_05 ED3]
MQLINHNGKIYLRFQSANKIIKRSLKLDFTKHNLAYVKQTLLPIFQKLALNKTTTLFSNHAISAKIQNINSNLPQNKVKFSLQTTQIPPKPYLLSHFCALYFADLRHHAKLSTQKTACVCINRAFDFLPDLHVRSYTHSQIYDAINAMKNSNLSHQSINLILNYLKNAFSLALKFGVTSQNPFEFIKKLPKFNKPKFCFTKAQIRLLLANAKGELRTFLFIAFYTGARSGEILALCKEDFDLNADKITIYKNQTRYELTTPKNGKSRTINLLKPLKNHILELNLGAGRIFSDDYFAILYKFKKLLKSLNLPPCGLHVTRHSFCSHLLSANISPTLIAHTLGHSNLEMINKIYGHFIKNRSDLRNLNRAMKL